MKRILLLSLLFTLSSPTTLWSAPSETASDYAQLPSDIKIVKLEFGIRDRSGQFVPTQYVKLSDAEAYGWRLEIETTRKNLNVSEVIVLPAPATHWQVGPNTTVSIDQTSATTTFNADVVANRFQTEQFWIYAPGDPFGNYSAEILVEGVRVKLFNFRVTP